jgi:flagella basal body P-ring formation protein FlgA
MTNLLRVLTALVALAACWPSPEGTAAEPRADARLRITLHQQVETSDRLVRIADVAQIVGGTPLLRERVGRLDLVKLEDDESTADVSRTLVQARLLLSDAAPDGFHVDGAPVTRVFVPINLTPEDRALAVARTAVARHLALTADDVVLRLAQPLSPYLVQAIQLTPSDQLEARVSMTPTGGNTRIELWTRDANGVQHAAPFVVDLRFRQIVPVARRPLKARDTLTADDVDMQPRELAHRGTGLELEQVLGKALRRSVVAGHILQDVDLTAPVAADEPVVVKVRDIVRVTVRKGALTLVMPAAEALQAGREGETIRIRNTNSGRVVIGRVTGAGEVEVPL